MKRYKINTYFNLVFVEKNNDNNLMAPWKNWTSQYISFFRPSLNGVLFPIFCLLVEGECQILVF